MKTAETSEIYDKAVELRELLNKIPDWKNRMSAQFLACVRIGNRELKSRNGDRRALADAISVLPTETKTGILSLTYILRDRGKYEFSGTPERYALRAFIMSVILGQEYADADAVALINGLREGVST